MNLCRRNDVSNSQLLGQLRKSYCAHAEGCRISKEKLKTTVLIDFRIEVLFKIISNKPSLLWEKIMVDCWPVDAVLLEIKLNRS